MSEYNLGDLVKLKLTTSETERRGPPQLGLFLRYDRYDTETVRFVLAGPRERYATVLIDGEQCEVWLDEIEKAENNE